MDAKGIARALRTQLQHLGLELTHSQVLELVAKTAQLKDWNTLATREKPSQPQGTGMFCPHCGKQGTVNSHCTAFVEQGPGNEDGYLFEADANHFVCSACGGQFLDWSSSWPQYMQEDGYVALVEPYMGRWKARLVPLGTMCAVLETHGWDREGMPEPGDKAAVLKAVQDISVEPEAHQDLIGRLQAYGVEALYSAYGDTLNDAVKTMLSRLPASEDAKVLNRGVGI